VAIAFLIPFNFLLYSVDNLFFLIFPVRIAQNQAGDLQNFGRTMLQFFTRMIILFLTVGVIAGLGALLYFGSKSWALTLIVSWILTVLASVIYVPFISFAFEKFDPSVDTPAS
jgi:type IV secretory pathway VirB2 component (pilin)